MITLILIWAAGFLLGRWMLKAEHLANNEEYTNGEIAVSCLLSCLSWLIVLIMLVKAWASSVSSYWKKPANNVKPKVD